MHRRRHAGNAMCGIQSDNKCRACNAGFKLADGACSVCASNTYNDGTAADCGTQFKCPGGTADSGTAANNALYKCTACTAPYVLSGDKCVPGDGAKARIGLPLKHGLLLASPKSLRGDLTTAIKKAVAEYLAATLPNKLGGITHADIDIGTPIGCTAANTTLGCPSENTTRFASMEVSLVDTEFGTATAEEIATALTNGTAFNKVLLYTEMGSSGTVGDNVEAEDGRALSTLQLQSAQAATPPEPDDDSGMSGGEITGIVIGSIVFVGIVVLMRKRSGSGGGGGMRAMRVGGKGSKRRVNWQPINDRVKFEIFLIQVSFV